MRIKKIEHSAMPGWISVKTTRLKLTPAEFDTLDKASEIISKAADLVFRHLAPTEKNPTMTLSDIDEDLSRIISAHQIDEFLEEHGTEGLKIY